MTDTLGMHPHYKVGIKSNTKMFNVLNQLNKCPSDVDRC